MNNAIINIIKKVLLVIVCLIIVFMISTKIGKKRVTLSGYSFMSGMQDTKELHTVKFEYGGIAYYFEGKEKEYFENGDKSDAKIKYKADIEALVNLEELDKNKKVDKDNKKVYLTLPNIDYKVTIRTDSYEEKDNVAEKNFETLGDVKYPLNILMEACRTDAIYEINHNKNIKETVIQSSRKSIEAFILPIAEREGYEIVWEGVE